MIGPWDYRQPPEQSDTTLKNIVTSSHPFSRVSASFLVFTCVSQGIFRVSFFIRLAVLIASVLELPNSVETHPGGFKWSFPFIIKCRSSISSVHHRQLLSFVSRKTCKLNLRLNVSSKWNNLIYLFCLCWKRSFFFSTRRICCHGYTERAMMQSDDNGSGSLYFKWWASRGLPLLHCCLTDSRFLSWHK